jgi:hypothetical protein
MHHTTAGRDRRYVVALWLVSSLLVAMAVTVPFAVASFLRDFGDPGSSVYSSNSPDAPVPDHRVSLDISEMDEVGVTLRSLPPRPASATRPASALTRSSARSTSMPRSRSCPRRVR